MTTSPEPVANPEATPTERLSERYRDLPLETVPCYLCGSEASRVIVDDPPFKVRECAQCGLGYTSPRLDGARIHEIYGDHYFNSESAEAFGYASYAEEMEGHLRTFRKKAAVIHAAQPTGRVLEVGCAAGAFLATMRDLGHEVHGTEIAPDTLDTAREAFGLENLQCGALHEVSLPDEHFDIVAMFDVVEHMVDPIRDLQTLHAKMRPGGLLVIQTQDFDSWARKVLGRRWHHFKQLEHIYHFSRRTLPVLLERAGFEITTQRKKSAGKAVSFSFIADRLERRFHVPRFLTRPMARLGRGRFIYLNVLDELFVLARKV